MDAQVLAELRRTTAPEDEALATARRGASATDPPDPEVGALLRWLARSRGVRTAVEIGNAGGVSGLWLAGGLLERGVLTSIEADPHTHGLATEAYAGAQVGTRIRSIRGEPAAVLPRLSDASYELVLAQAAPSTDLDVLDHARRLLRPGGLLVIRRALLRGDHAEQRAELIARLVDDEDLDVVALPLDDGLVLATHLGTPPVSI